MARGERKIKKKKNAKLKDSQWEELVVFYRENLIFLKFILAPIQYFFFRSSRLLNKLYARECVKQQCLRETKIKTVKKFHKFHKKISETSKIFLNFYPWK